MWDYAAFNQVPPPPPSRTDWTRLVPPPVLTGHVSSQAQPGEALGAQRRRLRRQHVCVGRPYQRVAGRVLRLRLARLRRDRPPRDPHSRPGLRVCAPPARSPAPPAPPAARQAGARCVLLRWNGTGRGRYLADHWATNLRTYTPFETRISVGKHTGQSSTLGAGVSRLAADGSRASVYSDTWENSVTLTNSDAQVASLFPPRAAPAPRRPCEPAPHEPCTEPRLHPPSPLP